MLRAIVHIVRSRLPRGLPGRVSIALAALVAAESVRLGVVLLAHGGPATREERHTGLTVAAVRSLGIDVASIAAAHLFGVPAAAPANMDPAAVPVVPSNLRLTGTLAARDPKRGAAIVSDDVKSAIYKVGASLGGAVLSQVYADRVILDRGGMLEALLMPRATSPGSEPTRLDESAGHGAASNAAATAGSEGLVPDNAGNIADVMRAGGPVMNEAGRMRGFRIFPGKDRSAFLASGLHGGDVVVAFNGTPVLEQNRLSGQDVFQTIRDSARTTLTIERNGQTRDITIDVAQAGSSLRPDSPVSVAPASSVE